MPRRRNHSSNNNNDHSSDDDDDDTPSSSNKPQSVTFQIGNTYLRIPDDKAQPSPQINGGLRIHDWILYCDVTSSDDSDADLIQQVVFDMKDDSYAPRSFTCRCPSRTKEGLWRFSTRQVTCESVRAEVTVRGRGGAVRSVRYSIVCAPGGGTSPQEETLWEPKPYKRLKPGKMIQERFVVELEMTISDKSHLSLTADAIKQRACLDVRTFHNAKKGDDYTRGWKIVPNCDDDHLADNDEYALVSRQLKGGEGLNELNKVVCGAKNGTGMRFNKRNFIVSVNVSSYSFAAIKKVCQVFTKFEAVMDSIMPPHARGDGNSYCRSIARALAGDTNKERHETIDAARSFADLRRLMNPHYPDAFYKLTLPDGKGGEEEMTFIEFRQHQATLDYEKMGNWVRFCVSLTKNASRLREVRPLKDNTRFDNQFSILFDYVIRDRGLRDYYLERRETFREVKKRLANGSQRVGNGGQRQKKKQRNDGHDRSRD